MFRSSIIIALASCFIVSAQAVTISVNFVGNAGVGGTLANGATAGVVPAANWNNLLANSGIDNTGTALVDSTGGSSGASISWSNIGPWAMNVGNTTGDQQMLNGYLDNFEDLRTVTVSGLSASQTYQFYIYSDGDNGSNTRTGSFTMGGVTTGIIDGPGTFNGTFTEVPAGTNAPGNYAVFTLTGATSYDLTFHGNNTDDLARAPLNGLQVVSIPESGSALLAAAGLVMSLRRSRRK
jgi:hypothetical protein